MASSLPPSISDRVKEVIALLCVAALITLCVIGKFDNALVFDDVGVVGGDLIHDPSRMGEVFVGRTMIAQGHNEPAAMDTYRPIPLLTFFWDAWLSGHDTWSYHLTNHLLHLAATLCVYWVARTLLPEAGMWVAVAVATFFGLSPQLAEAHVWINGRSDPLAAVFGLAGLLVWDGWHADLRRMGWRPVVASALILVGLMSKEVLLLGIPSLVFWPKHRGRTIVWRLGRMLPFLVAVVVYMAARVPALDGVRVSAGGDQVVTAVANLPVLWMDGLSELVVPSRLYLRSMRDEYALLSVSQRACLVGLAAVLCFVIWWLRKRAPVLAWGSAWFAATLAPAAMISAVLWPGFGRYLYLPCIGVALAMGEAWVAAYAALARARLGDTGGGIGRRGLLAAVVASVYLASAGLRLASTTEMYANNESLYSTAILASPAPAFAIAALGDHYVEMRDTPRAIAALRLAVKEDPREPVYVHDLIRALLRAGDSLGAEQEARRALAVAPEQLAGNLRAQLVYALAGRDPGGAVSELCTCLKHQPDLPECRRVVAALLDPRGPAFQQLREALAMAVETEESPVARRALVRALEDYGVYHYLR